LLLSLVSITGFSQKKLMFVGNAADLESTTYQSEIDLFDSVTAWGFTPEYWSSSDISAGGLESFYPDYDGIFITEWVGSSSVNNIGTDNYQLPIVSMEGWSHRVDRWDWITDNDTEFYQSTDEDSEDDTKIIITDNSHYITSIFDLDQEVTWTTVPEPIVLADVNPSSAKEVNVEWEAALAINKSHSAMDGMYTMMTVSDETLPNKVFMWGIVAMGLDGEGLGVNGATPEFYTILKRACQWAYDEMENTAVEDVRNKPSFELTAFPNPASERVVVRFESPAEGAGVASLYSITGQRMDEFNMNVIPGRNYLELRAGDYAPGVYHLSLEMQGRVEYVKIVMQ
jgi:hypothetical protein